jgi:neutral trehalase
MDTNKQLLEDAQAVLQKNNRDTYTVPAAGIYPHQWLWDSCFVAIGLRHTDVARAQAEIRSLLTGQWHNGMLPNIIFNNDARYANDRNIWRSWLNPNSPDHLATSGITQPPMLAEAIVQIGEKLSLPERRSWYKETWPALLAYHEWLYSERDPHQEGLVLQIHPWEVGMDNTPAWTTILREHLLPVWVRGIQKLHLVWFIELFRRDTISIPLDERFDTVEALALFDVQRRLRRKNYEIDKILDHSLFTIEDLAFNAIFIRANTHLLAIAKTLGITLEPWLKERIKKSRESFDGLWDEETQQYYSRDFITHHLLRQPSVATLLPLYAGCIDKERAHHLVRMLESDQQYGPAYPVPSVPLNSPDFTPLRYWQGPTWLNINWLIIDGLKRNGFKDHADALSELSLELVEKSGFAEYFDPITGQPLGIKDFSWTAALAIDLLKR